MHKFCTTKLIIAQVLQDLRVYEHSLKNQKSRGMFYIKSVGPQRITVFQL